MKESIWALSTFSKKGKGNEDFCATCHRNDYSAMILADGIGQSIYPKESSELVVKFLLDNLPPNYSDVKFDLLFMQANQVLVERSKREDDQEDEDGELYGTTLITVLETQTTFVLAYVGNGAFWHLRGNFDEKPPGRNIPLNALNLLNPHSISNRGREVLTRFLSDSETTVECSPTILTITKDQSYGDLILVCTDGIDSWDQIKIGRNSKGDWVQFNPMVNELIQMMVNYLNGLVDNCSSDSIQNDILSYLEENSHRLEDDATIGVVLTKDLLNRWNSDEN